MSLGEVIQLQLESLFVDLSTPLVPFALFHKPEAGLLIEVSCGVEALKGPQVHPFIPLTSTEGYCGTDQLIAGAFSP